MRKINMARVAVKPPCLRFYSSLSLKRPFVPLQCRKARGAGVRCSVEPGPSSLCALPLRASDWLPAWPPDAGLWVRCLSPLPSPPSHSPRNPWGPCYSCLHPQGLEARWSRRLSGVKVTSRSSAFSPIPDTFSLL